ncbi:MAG TPA: PfkB family carbohydrate kinase [Streptosporangiaceae bacterium]|nr:PfkB family carbohydrate kinase [Streptosporangiaceae bacterium]
MTGSQLNPELDLLVLGDCNPDVLVLGGDVTPEFGQQEKLVSTISLVVGGSAAITAIAAARLGLRVALAATIGADPAGDFMLGQLSAAGVDTAHVRVLPGEATGMTVALSRGADRAIITATGAMAALTAGDVPSDLIRRAGHVHVSSYFLLEQSLGPGLAGLLADARAGGATTSLDTNWDPAGRWGGGQLRAALAHTDLLLPNEAEARHLSGEPTLRGAIVALTGMGPRVVVKLGASGALSAAGGELHRIEPRAVDTAVVDTTVVDTTVVDTTGAGDCFNAGLIAGLLGGLDLPAAARLGCAVGTASTRAAGGTAAAPSLAAALELAESVDVRPGWQ